MAYLRRFKGDWATSVYLHRSFSNRRAYLNTIEDRRSGRHDDEDGAGPSGTHRSDDDDHGEGGDENLGDKNNLTREDDEDEFADSDDDDGD